MELRDYLTIIRFRKWVVIQAIIVVVFAAVAVSFLQPKMYQGEVQILISEKDTGAAIFGTLLPELSAQPERAMQTQVQMIKLRPVAEATIKELGLQMGPDALLKRVTATAIGQTNLVKVTVTDGDPKEAAAIANSLADQYVESARNAQRESLASAADEVQRRLDEARAEILAVGQKIADSGKSDELATELQIATDTYSTLAEKLEQLRISEQLESGPARVVSPAVVNMRQVAPRPLRNAALGLAVGLVFGLGMAFLNDYLDNTIKSTEEAERIFGAPVLGTVPADKIEKGQKRRLAIVQAPGSSTAEAYRVLRNSLDFMNFQHDLKTLLITSAAPGEGKSTVAANLAAALSQAGKKVVLVCTDFRRPTIDQFFNVNNVIGLSDVLLSTHTLKAALQRPGDDQLLVLNAGKMPPNPSELLSSQKMEEVINSLEEWGDWVIIDSPPMLAVADPATVSRWADSVLIVTQAGVSTRDASKRALELLNKVGARIMGVVAWGLDEDKASGGYGYGYYAGAYYYANYYSTPTPVGRDNGARAVGATADVAQQWVPQESGARRVARFVGKLAAGFLGFLVVVAIAALVVYFLDQYFGWGIANSILSLLPWSL